MLYALAIGALLGLLSVFVRKNRTRTVHTPTVTPMNLAAICQLRPGPAQALLIRQSGNLYRDLGYFQNSDDACRAIERSFRKAQIHSVSVLQNSTSVFEISRRLYDGRGRAEGKKLGGAIVTAC